MKKNLNTFNGFQNLDVKKQKNISAAGLNIASVVSLASSISNLKFDNLNGVLTTASDVILKHRVISKIDEITKGEIEFGKDGIFKMKWDNSEPKPNSKSSFIIF